MKTQLISKSIAKIKYSIVKIFFLKLRIFKFYLLSDLTNMIGKPIIHCPVFIDSKGKIIFQENVNIGVPESPNALSGYSYISARNKKASIIFRNDIYLNNHATIISEGEGIEIGSNTIIGFNFCVFDSDFHNLEIDKRMTGNPKTAKVMIGNNVFIGSNVTVLKGVSIGDNSVIGAASVVYHSIPENVIAAGNPCKVIKHLA
jgi:acetyltransferase-like isoleucine patch superfamily enzyme